MILYRRISSELNRALPAYQKGRSTIEQIQSLQQIIEKVNEFNRQGIICFIDFKKAFDSVYQEKLWEILNYQTSINSSYINLLANMYENSSSRIRTDLGITRNISIRRGVKQGDLPSAVLFCLILHAILSETFHQLNYGIKLGGENITDKGYADDVGLMTESVEQMNIVLNRLYIIAKRYGMSINIKKTKVMFIGKHNQDAVSTPDYKLSTTNNCINNVPVEVVTKFEYLGRILTNTGDDTPAVKARIGCGWDAFNKVKGIICSRHISMATKRKTFETYILPSIFYAAETITWKPQLIHHITVFQNHIMRFMCNKRLIDKTPITDLIEMTSLQSVTKVVKKRKLSWYGHIKRSSLPVRTIFEGMVPGKRGRGRPKRRWRDDIYEWSEKTLLELNFLVNDRIGWKDMINNV